VANITPRHEFGFGLSCTTFEYSDLLVSPVLGEEDQAGWFEANWASGNPTPLAVSSTALWLHRAFLSVSFTVENTGECAGT
jgi:hypothetical protein